MDGFVEVMKVGDWAEVSLQINHNKLEVRKCIEKKQVENAWLGEETVWENGVGIISTGCCSHHKVPLQAGRIRPNIFVATRCRLCQSPWIVKGRTTCEISQGNSASEQRPVLLGDERWTGCGLRRHAPRSTRTCPHVGKSIGIK